MKKILLIFSLSFIAVKGFSQQFSQYNTGTLYDSFENPAQRSFVPDSSKMYATNFFVPNFSGNFFLTGDAQTSLVSRAFGSKYNNAALLIGNGAVNRININANVYSLMFKLFASLDGEEELGIFTETRSEGRGSITDESIALFSGPAAFPANIYDNTFNNHFYNQIYNALGITYRERLSSQFVIGFRASFLMGINYTKLDTYESHISFDKINDAATLALRGQYRSSKGPGKFDSRSFLPTSRSPGAQISIGTSYTTEDKITFQGNVKDLGFIHWYDNSSISNFNNVTTITGLTAPKHEARIYSSAYQLIANNRVPGSFTTYTDGRFELSATKTYQLDEQFKYSPTLIASKELMYNGVTGAMVNRFQYADKYNFSVTTSYDNLNIFNLGLQLMYKTHNAEFFIGSERLTQTIGFMSARGNSANYTNSTYTGGDIFLGFSMKFGPIIEHPLNAHSIPNGEKGFIGRLWNRLFKAY